jgi:hypothetical protein
MANKNLFVSMDELLDVVRLKFETEKNAKNTAYHFILVNGHFESFKSFCQANEGVDHFEGCRQWLESASQKGGEG